MTQRLITREQIENYHRYLLEEERAADTIQKYLHDLQEFVSWLNNQEVTKEKVVQWKEILINRGRAPVTVNTVLAALHGFFSFMHWDECKVKYLKRQRRIFRESEKELNKEEYRKLVFTAERMKNYRISLIMETICSTGIRVSEIKYITIESAQKGIAEISLKGKIRTILIPRKLTHKLLKYAKKQKIVSGEIFLTRNGNGMSRKLIWVEMKRLCAIAGVDKTKVFPHNLRHLFARSYYKMHRDIVRLADVLGHNSIDTTRIYLVTTTTEYAKELNYLGLVL